MSSSIVFVRDYIALTKPRIISLLLVTALGGMFMAANYRDKGLPELSLVLLVLVGGALAAGGAHALNHFLERDIDQLMPRTSSRPVASGRISPISALIFGIILNIMSFAILYFMVNYLSAVITLSGTLFYALIYTMLLKRTTPQNIVIGGAAGSVPPVVGWVAVTGSVDLPAIFLFAIIFFWTPPHFWALALMIKDDYQAANIPMLPVVVGIEKTKRSIVLYTFILVVLSLVFFATQSLGWFYFVSVSVLGGLFVYYSVKLLRESGILFAKQLYIYSLFYLAFFFLVVVLDGLIMS